MLYKNQTIAGNHSEEILEIVESDLSWVLRWGISVFFLVMITMLCLSALIKYPEVIHSDLTLQSPVSPKPVVTKFDGRLVKILITENAAVLNDQALAYMESTADHESVLSLLQNLKVIKYKMSSNLPVDFLAITKSGNITLGELQSDYQLFYEQFLIYRSGSPGGLNLKNRGYLKDDLHILQKRTQELNIKRTLEIKDLDLAQQEFLMHKQLLAAKVESQAEFRQEESKFLSKKASSIQTTNAIINLSGDYLTKSKELFELENQIGLAREKFLQALNTIISRLEDWKGKYVLSAGQGGKVIFADLFQEGQVLKAKQDVFFIDKDNEQYFGSVKIIQSNLGKIKVGQEVLVKLKSYPFEEFGVIHGHVQYISDIPDKDGLFFLKVALNDLNKFKSQKTIVIKQGMVADAEIIVQHGSLFRRLLSGIIKKRSD